MSDPNPHRPILVLESGGPWLGSGLDLTLRQPGLAWESASRALLFGQVRDLLAPVSGWQVEYQPSLDPERLALFPDLSDPGSMAARGRLAENLTEAIERLSGQSRTLPLVDWTLRPWLLSHPAIDGAEVPDESRHAELRRLRQPLLAPWLAGSRPVLDLAVFTEFYTELDAGERAVFEDLRPAWDSGLALDELSSWQRQAANRLIIRGFAQTEARRAGPGRNETRLVRRLKSNQLASWEQLAR